MTPAPADLSRVLRLHGYEPNITLPDAMRRRIASDLGIAPSELESHIQAQSAPPEPQMETIDKSLPRRERVLKACEALGRHPLDAFSEREKVEFTALLGIQRKAAMQYLRDTRAEFAEMNSHSAPEPQESEDQATVTVECPEPDAKIHTTACTVHPTHTATRCEACVKLEFDRAEDAGIEALMLTGQLNEARAALTKSEVRASSAVAELSSQLDAATEAKETPCLRCKTRLADNCRPCINQELKEAEVRVRTETAAQYEAHLNRSLEADSRLRSDFGYAHQNLDELEAPENDHLSVRIERFGTIYRELQAAHENLMRETAALKEQARAGDLSEIATTLHLPGDATLSRIIDAIHLLQDVAANDEEQKAATYAETVKRRMELCNALSEAYNNPKADRSAFALFQRPKPELNDDACDLAITLLRDSGNGLLTMRERAAVLQLAADMAALAAAR